MKWADASAGERTLTVIYTASLPGRNTTANEHFVHYFVSVCARKWHACIYPSIHTVYSSHAQIHVNRSSTKFKNSLYALTHPRYTKVFFSFFNTFSPLLLLCCWRFPLKNGFTISHTRKSCYNSVAFIPLCFVLCWYSLFSWFVCSGIAGRRSRSSKRNEQKPTVTTIAEKSETNEKKEIFCIAECVCVCVCLSCHHRYYHCYCFFFHFWKMRCRR